MFSDDPCVSIRRASTALKIPCNDIASDITQVSASFLRRHKHFKLTQQSYRQDRLKFSHCCQQRPVSYSEFLSRILFTYECMFHLNGHANTQIQRIWGKSLTKGKREPANSTGIIFRCVISTDKIKRSCKIEDGKVTGDTYRNLVIRKVFPRLQLLSSDFDFRKNSTAPHVSNIVRAYSNRASHNY